jgi:hypothetical protein
MARRSSIDLLIQTELGKKSLKLREPAEPHQLVRRAYLDLIGVPPTIEEANAFAANPTEAAWEKLIDDLLARPEFGEQWARVWMDLARYADTKGYEKGPGPDDVALPRLADPLNQRRYAARPDDGRTAGG